MPQISVIVPVYKVEKDLTRCVDSLINQTLQDIEIILVDDGSPDECPAICDNYARQDKRIKAVSYTHLDVYKRQLFGCGGEEITVQEVIIVE